GGKGTRGGVGVRTRQYVGVTGGLSGKPAPTALYRLGRDAPGPFLTFPGLVTASLDLKFGNGNIAVRILITLVSQGSKADRPDAWDRPGEPKIEIAEVARAFILLVLEPFVLLIQEFQAAGQDGIPVEPGRIAVAQDGDPVDGDIRGKGHLQPRLFALGGRVIPRCEPGRFQVTVEGVAGGPSGPERTGGQGQVRAMLADQRILII